MAYTSKASERELRDFDAAGVITTARIDRVREGYFLVIQVSWKSGDIVIFAQRNKPRYWQSLDRLIAHLAEVAPSIKALAEVKLAC
jgi:hypothetical protein